MGHFHNPPPGPILGATAAQPYGPPKLTPPGIPVNNPPFSNPSRTQQVIAENASLAQPDPWVYVFEGKGGANSQPYSPGQRTPPGIPVNNPPQNGDQAGNLAEILALWQSDPWGYSFQAQDASQPYAPGKLPVLSPVVVFVPNTSALAALVSVVQAWQPGDAPIQLSGKLSPGIPGQSVDNPPGLRVLQNPYPSDVYPVQRSVYLPQPAAAAAVQNPFFNAWLSGVLASWQPGDPPIQLPRNLNPFFTAVEVDNPPSYSLAWLAGILNQWQPGDPLPTLSGKLSPGIPGQSIDNPPGIVFRQNPYPADVAFAPQQLVLLPQPAAAVAVQNPYFAAWLSTVLQSWQPGDPPVTLPRNLNPFFLGVNVDNPPFSYGGRNAWASDIANRAWQPPDPLPTLSGKLPPTIIAVRVDNPPFSSRSELANILGQWQFPPPQPTPSAAPLQPQGGTTPPPPVIVAQFTVSGSGVSLVFTEFFSDVVFTDAPVTKRTN